MFCNRCGHRNPDDATFCGRCDSVLDRLDDQTGALSTLGPANNHTPNVPPREITERGAAQLILGNGPNTGDRHHLNQDLTRLGRDPNNELVLDDITVSRHHAEIERIAAAYFVRDNGSLNGTYVNTQRIDETQLHHGDELQVGKFCLLFINQA